MSNLEQSLKKLREDMVEAAREWSGYVEVDNAPRTCADHIAQAFDKAIEELTDAVKRSQEPFGHFHQLLNHEGKGDGVWLGCPDKRIVEQSYVEGEVGKEIVALYTKEQIAFLECQHDFHFFGDQPKRRCNNCNAIEQKVE